MDIEILYFVSVKINIFVIDCRLLFLKNVMYKSMFLKRVVRFIMRRGVIFMVI